MDFGNSQNRDRMRFKIIFCRLLGSGFLLGKWVGSGPRFFSDPLILLLQTKLLLFQRFLIFVIGFF